MEKSTVSKRKRQALLALPVVIIPFLTMAFWALGGGKGEARQQDSSSGLNLQLPGAQLKSDASQNKMSFYDQAEKDSARRREGQQADRYSIIPSIDTTARRDLGPHEQSYNPYPSITGTYKDPNEEKVYQKLAQLNQQLYSSTTDENKKDKLVERANDRTVATSRAEEERLERTLQKVNSGNAEDTEINNLNQMMEKVLDIQHPERVRERIKEGTGKSKTTVYSTNKKGFTSSVSLLDTMPLKARPANGFYGLQTTTQFNESPAMEAVVHEAQTLVDGAVIKLRLLQEITINGTVIPKDVFVFGIASLNGERLEVVISSIRYKTTLLPVKLTVYDMDGLPGIYIPGAITREVAKSSVDNAAQMLEITSLDPSLKAQATSAGLGAVKSLLSKKTKLVKVVVKGGYQVLLKDASSN